MGLFDSLLKKAKDAVDAKTEEITKKVEDIHKKITSTPLDVLVKEKAASKKNKRNPNSTAFTPNPNKTEYENWLDYLDKGGTTEEWEILKESNHFKFKVDKSQIFDQYQNEVKSVSDKYFSLMEKIQRNWSILYNLNDWFGTVAITLEKDCLDDITYYKTMREIDKKYGEKSPTNIPAFKRLAMLYEKQDKFEDAIAVCKEAFKYGMDERGRMLRMIKKAGRTPTTKEMALINK